MKEAISTILLAFCTGGLGAAIINVLGGRWQFRQERKAHKEDRAELKIEERLKAIEAATAAQGEALKFILYDRIRYLAQAYIADGEIDFDDRRILNEMHRAYHDGLGGNGDLDVLMKSVNELPLKVKK